MSEHWICEEIRKLLATESPIDSYDARRLKYKQDAARKYHADYISAVWRARADDEERQNERRWEWWENRKRWAT